MFTVMMHHDGINNLDINGLITWLLHVNYIRESMLGACPNPRTIREQKQIELLQETR